MSAQECVVCQAPEASLLFRTRDRHYGLLGEFSIVQSSGCGVVRLDPIPSAEELAGFYTQSYYAYQPMSKEPWLKGLARRLLRLKIVTHNPKFAVPGEFLDIGCGSGDYLRVMQAKGWKVQGVEPSSFGATEGHRAGFDIFNCTLTEAKLASNSFDGTEVLAVDRMWSPTSSTSLPNG
jgi:hypothetical protein